MVIRTTRIATTRTLYTSVRYSLYLWSLLHDIISVEDMVAEAGNLSLAQMLAFQEHLISYTCLACHCILVIACHCMLVIACHCVPLHACHCLPLYACHCLSLRATACLSLLTTVCLSLLAIACLSLLAFQRSLLPEANLEGLVCGNFDEAQVTRCRITRLVDTSQPGSVQPGSARHSR